MSLPNVCSRVRFLRASSHRLICGLVMLGLLLGARGQGRTDSIYWSDSIPSSPAGDIRRANLDGSGQTILVSGLSGPIGPALHLVGGQMYWTDTNAGDIQRANLDGSGQTTLVSGLAAVPNLPGAWSPALDLARGQMYWTDGLEGASGAIRRANLDGSGQTTLVSGLPAPRGVALDLARGQMYWADAAGGDIQRANLDGSGQTTLLKGLTRPVQVALDLVGGKIYVPDRYDGQILRANLDGTGQEILVQGLNGPVGIALDVARGQMYWCEFDGGAIRRANLDGTGQETLITGLPSPAYVALDLGAPGFAIFFSLAAPASVVPGTPFEVTVTALDPYGNTDVNYQGTVTFSTSDTDPGIVLPADYTFTPDDAGVHTFTGGLSLSTPGDQTITATDTASGITRTVTVTVVPPN
jgi:sugar lactone lactonase YvrE